MAENELDNLLNDEPEYSLIRPEILETGTRIATCLLQAGCEGWGVLLGRGTLFTEGATQYQSPAEVLADAKGKVVITKCAWSGDREGELYFILSEAGAKGIVAFMLAAMMGSETDPETTELDAEGLDAYAEALNNYLGPASQALRQELGVDLTLTAAPPRVVDFEASPPALELGTEEMLCHTGQMTIEGMAPVTVYLLFSVSITGMSTEIEKKAEEKTGEAEPEAEKAKSPNQGIVMNVKVPLRVILATKKMRMEIIQALTPGSIIEFRKGSSELLDVCAGNCKIAEGEVVLTNEHFGIQIRRLIDIRAAIS